MNWGDIYDNESKATSIWQKLGEVIMIVAFAAVFIGLMWVGSAYEEHRLCMNGAIEHCIEEDFQ